MMLIYTTCSNEKEAQKIAAALLKARLVGCANWWSIRGSYVWKRKVEKVREVALLLKTKERHFKAVEKIIKKLHSYDTPCIIGWGVDKVNKEYLEWLQSVTL